MPKAARARVASPPAGTALARAAKECLPGRVRLGEVRNLCNRNVTDPLGAGFVDSLARPGGNATGFMIYVEVTPLDSRSDAGEIESRITTFAGSPNGGLIVTPNAAAMPAGYKLIITLAARFKLPTIYPFPNAVAEGGLMSHSPNVIDQSRQAAGYVNRILKGEKPADLPVQGLGKYDLTINLKTAKALGLTVPPALLAQADKVIE